MTQTPANSETAGARRRKTAVDAVPPGAEPGQGGARRVMARCDEVALISAMEHGIERTYLTSQHKAHNRLAAQWMRSAGLQTRVDEAGTLRGRLPGATPDAPVLYLGSHLDTVPDAGKYDGILGVTAAIEVASRFAERAQAGEPLPFALEVLAFGDEEGVRFGATLLGSRAMAGTWDPDWFELKDARGVTLREAMEEFGLDPDRVYDAAIDPEQTVGYLEAHIEQGPYLQDADKALGLVTSIAGARRLTVTVIGEAGHAGGTPYGRRRDALIGSSHAVIAIDRIGQERGVIVTVGELTVVDGAINVVPGRVEFTIDLRAATDEDRDAAYDEMIAELQSICLDRDLQVTVHEHHRAPGALCDPELMEAVREGIVATGDEEPMSLYSKAGHDAMAIAEVAPMAMLFTRCLDGISHNPGESVRHDDVDRALDALETAIRRIARNAA
ncbi:allantoate amidohydrolase [Rothia halotolerans]|uniref:allantoate amidohydrolase n=1 Tax=Rothia halotolerans TaxID=405770 RepID=UPI00101C507F|nr:allantoate amidohydrolase [Rothia halotolerans]